ncbi:glycoside/pentoside/hexuronide transporter [Synechococcus sp. PCC 7502]|uniref:MFS transporter n=1 Tax=Synechococcus sp. PCC 7502 TaxID=1173263 RepID=UPI00029FE72E|nr:MFS transporter [Synechococcus sp. PCC 7502]AFY73522.1 glycoside/pentoside/hexuronide transporter [Synechococcus sp. PCC 7502]
MQSDYLGTKLNFKTKLSYGIGEIGASIFVTIRAFFQLFFLTNVAGLNPSLAGTVLLIGRIWDAVNDPVIGWLSDRTVSKWGKRHSWMLWGSIPFASLSVMQWIVPNFSSELQLNQIFLFWYYAAISLLADTAFSAVFLPYLALIPDLTQDYHERTGLNGFKAAFGLGAGIFALIVAQIIFAKISNPQDKYLMMAIAFAILSTLTIFVCIWGTRPQLRLMNKHISINDHNDNSPNLIAQMRIVLSNIPFLILMGIYLCSWIAVQTNSAILPYFVVNWMGLPDQHFAQAAIAVQGTALIMMIPWSILSQRLGKKAVYFLGIPLWAIAQIGLFLVQPGQVVLMYGLAVLAGAGISVVYLIPGAMLPDVIDYEELRTGQRQEGVFYGFVTQLLKIGIAIALFLVGKTLDWSNFIPTIAENSPPIQPESALWAIRLMISLVPILALLGGIFFAFVYPISRLRHEEILLKLRELGLRPQIPLNPH